MYARRQLLLDDGVTTLTDVEHVVVADDGSHIAVFLGNFRKRQQTVESGDERGIHLNLRNEILHRHHQFVEQSLFHRENFLVGTMFDEFL